MPTSVMGNALLVNCGVANYASANNLISCVSLGYVPHFKSVIALHASCLQHSLLVMVYVFAYLSSKTMLLTSLYPDMLEQI